MSETTQIVMDPAAIAAMAAELGELRERERQRALQEELARAKQEAAEEEARRVSISEQPLVTVEWERHPQEHSCNVGGRQYRGRGPLVNRATGRKVKPGERQKVPACDAVVLEEGGFVTVVEGREHCVFTPVPFMPGVVDNMPDPADGGAWEKLAVG